VTGLQRGWPRQRRPTTPSRSAMRASSGPRRRRLVDIDDRARPRRVSRAVPSRAPAAAPGV